MGNGLKVREDLGMLCPVCDEAAEFERASGFGGVTLDEHFVCRQCRARIERHYRVDRTISCIKVQRLESCSWVNEPAQAGIDNSNFAAEEAGGLEQRRDPEIFHRHANGRRDIQTHERSPGKCPHCGSKDLWDDNLAYGCRSCKAILGGN